VEHFRALATLVEPPAPEHGHVARALGLAEPASATDYSDLFLFQVYPYASVYLGAEGMLGGASRDRIAGFWRALDLVPPREPDHLAVMLSLHAQLGEMESRAAADEQLAWRRARHAHFWEHLMSWLPAWLSALVEIAPAPYRTWSRLLEAALAEEATTIGPAAALPRHLSEAPPISDPRVNGLDPFVVSLLAPARSGVLLTRADLARAAADLGLGLRAGERRYALHALLTQDPSATLQWLRGTCGEWGARHRAAQHVGGIVTNHWIERAGKTAALVKELEIEAMEVSHVAGAGNESRSDR